MLKKEEIRQGLRFEWEQLPSGTETRSELNITCEEIALNYLFSVSDSVRNEEEDAPAYSLRFVFNRTYFNGLGNTSSITTAGFQTSFNNELCCNSQMLLHEIVNCRWEGMFRKMFLESRAIALLLCYQKCCTPTETDCSSCKFLTKPIEREKILKTKELILENLHAPLTIREISLRIGINECYLKKGFKEVFGSTVYDFVQQERMQRAKMYLAMTDYSVSQVAELIGFSSVSSFSTAFKKYSGVFPSEVRQEAFSPLE